MSNVSTKGPRAKKYKQSMLSFIKPLLPSGRAAGIYGTYNDFRPTVLTNEY